MIHRDSSKIRGVPLLVLSVNSWAQTKNPELTPYKKISSSSCFRWPSWFNCQEKRAPKRWLRLLNEDRIHNHLIQPSKIRKKKLNNDHQITTKKSLLQLYDQSRVMSFKTVRETQPTRQLPDSQAVSEMLKAFSKRMLPKLPVSTSQITVACESKMRFACKGTCKMMGGFQTLLYFSFWTLFALFGSTI